MSIVSIAIGFASTMIIVAKVCANLVDGMGNCSDPEYTSVIVRACIVDMVVAVMVLLVTGRNHMLFVVSSMRTSAHDVALRRCFGADRFDVLKFTLLRGLRIVSLALLLAFAIIAAVTLTLGNYIGIVPIRFIHPYSLCVYAVMIILMIICVGIVPGVLYNRQPLALVGHKVYKPRRSWKMGILSMQMLFFNSILAIAVMIYNTYGRLDVSHYSFPHIHVIEFANTVAVGGVGSIIVLLIGLLFFIQQEVESRSKEMAIRRICGCSRQQMVWMLVADCVKLVIPISVFAAITAVLTITLVFYEYMSEFRSPWELLLLIHVGINLIIISVIAFKAYSIINDNPAKKLRYE